MNNLIDHKCFNYMIENVCWDSSSNVSFGIHDDSLYSYLKLRTIYIIYTEPWSLLITFPTNHYFCLKLGGAIGTHIRVDVTLVSP